MHLKNAAFLPVFLMLSLKIPMASKSPFQDSGSSEAAVESMYLFGNSGTCQHRLISLVQEIRGTEHCLLFGSQ